MIFSRKSVRYLVRLMHNGFNEQKLKKVYDELTAKLESVSGMTREQARQSLLEALEDMR